MGAGRLQGGRDSVATLYARGKAPPTGKRRSSAGSCRRYVEWILWNFDSTAVLSVMCEVRERAAEP